ncbi:MAG: hypothetical protein HY300_00945 [Verrucomicrobia bacterium]|nr:hypothetical protein [Verrucomicrobiota bacterium]
MITERVATNNVGGNMLRCQLSTPNTHLANTAEAGRQANRFHNGRYNYLYFDSHAQLLRPQQTLGTASPAGTLATPRGQWTLLPTD